MTGTRERRMICAATLSEVMEDRRSRRCNGMRMRGGVALDGDGVNEDFRDAEENGAACLDALLFESAN